MSQHPLREHPSTYFVQDRTNLSERERLQVQDRFLTTGMGGVLPEQAETSHVRRVLDVGCGTGGWLIELAQNYPHLKLLIGVDISRTIVGYARTQAEAAQVSDRVEFHPMDALRMLEFPTNYFDLINQRAGVSYLRTWDWPQLFLEYQRVTRVGGVIRVTEFDLVPRSTSSALRTLCELLVQALYSAGHLFTQQSTGITSTLSHLLEVHGVQQVQTRPCTLEYQPGTPLWQGLVADVELGFRTLAPFLRKWIRVPDTYDVIHQQALREMQQPDFVGAGELLTAWGTVS